MNFPVYPKDHSICSQRELQIKEQQRPDHLRMEVLLLEPDSVWTGDTGAV